MPAPRKRGTPSVRIPESVLRVGDFWAKTTREGKPGISVRDHCLNVGCVAESLLSFLPSQLRALVPHGAITLAALHDVGKVSPGFQVKCEAWLLQHALQGRALKEGWFVQESDHAKISQSTIQDLLNDANLNRWAAAVGAHHGRIKGEQVPAYETWEQERLLLAGELIETFGPLPREPGAESVIWFLAGMITVADWIGSDERHFPQDVRWGMLERRNHARAALAAINWKPAMPRSLNGFSELFPEIPEANGLQTASMETVCNPGVYIIEGPMGFGKTEASLAAAYQLIRDGKANGIYFALPTQVTSNRIHERLEPFVDRISMEPADVRLAHSASWLTESEPPAQLSPAILTDQEAVDHVRSGRSWFASSNKCAGIKVIGVHFIFADGGSQQTRDLRKEFVQRPLRKNDTGLFFLRSKKFGQTLRLINGFGRVITDDAVEVERDSQLWLRFVVDIFRWKNTTSRCTLHYRFLYIFRVCRQEQSSIEWYQISDWVPTTDKDCSADVQTVMLN